MIKVFENEYAELYDMSDEIPHVLFGYWRGYWQLSDEEAMRALQFPLDYVKEKGIKIMLTDYKDLDVVPEETNVWLLEHWFPTVVANGLRAEIVLDASDLLGQLSVEFMYETVNQDTGLVTPQANNLEQGKAMARELLAKWAKETDVI
jgi:hypothetical protein